MQKNYAVSMEAEVEEPLAKVGLFVREPWGVIQSDTTLRPGMGTWASKFIPRSPVCPKWALSATSDTLEVQNYLTSKNG